MPTRFALLALPPTLLLYRLLIARARRRVGSAHRRILRAIDEDAEADVAAGIDAAAAARTPSSTSFPTSISDPAPSSSSSRAQATLSLSEHLLQRARRQLRTLRWEARAVVADGLFILYEALRPQVDKPTVEGLSGVFASLIRIGLLCS